MNIRIITASAGSGKTTRLSQVLDDAIGSGRVRPEAIIATTFTRHAAAELIERARARLLASGHGRQAHQLLAARIGTVNAVCGALVTDFAFELGLPPTLRVLDEGSAELELNRALATVVSSELSDTLFGFRALFADELDWRFEVRRMIEAARANGLDPDALRACAARSSAALDACLGPVAAPPRDLDAELAAALAGALDAIDTDEDDTKGTAGYVELLEDAARQLAAGRLRWGAWARLASAAPCKPSQAAAAPVTAAAAAHAAHPRLRADLHRLIGLLFGVAADGLRAYQAHKRALGVIDFGDQEALALALLRRPDVRAALAGQIDLVLVDEFQDTSPLQLAIFLELAALARESVWVGDQKQAIYGFRGTDPALMDAMIEELSSPTADPELIGRAVAAVGAAPERIETLTTSYRSRPALVELTSDLFARTFVHHGIPEERTRLAPHLTTEPPGLGPIAERWTLHTPPKTRSNKANRAAALAEGVRATLAGAAQIRDRQSGEVRTATPGDLAVLCRTNEECQAVATALGHLGLPAVLPRMGLLGTAEAQVALAGLALWLDPRDALAAARLARTVTYAGDLDGLVARALAAPGAAAFAEDPLVAAILSARAAAPDRDPVAVLDAVIDATDLRGLAASWGDAAQRVANLDALRAHALAYVAQARSRREAATLVGLLGYVDELRGGWGWNATAADAQAVRADADAVTVSTWHAAKGREWPIVVLYGLEALRAPRADGLHVETDAARFDLATPLAGRWLRYWPNPYTTANQGGPVREAYQQSAEFAAVVARAEREALRLAYVGWTRARDRLVLAAAPDKLCAGLLGTLHTLEPDILVEPPGTDVPVTTRVTWAGRTIALRVCPLLPAEPAPTPPAPGEVLVGRPPAAYPPARLSPSEAAPVPCTIGAPVRLGARLPHHGEPDMSLLGDAVHAYLAIDRGDAPEADRIARAAALLEAWGVAAHLAAADVARAGERLRTWLEGTLRATRVHREWPLLERAAAGTLIAGTADLVARTAAGYVLVDHKTFPGTEARALERLPRYAGQLATYAHAITAATGVPVVSTWIHLPVLGIVVPVELAAPGAR